MDDKDLCGWKMIGHPELGYLVDYRMNDATARYFVKMEGGYELSQPILLMTHEELKEKMEAAQ